MKNLYPSLTSVAHIGQNLVRKYLADLKSYGKKNNYFEISASEGLLYM